MAGKILGNTAICKLIIEKEDGKDTYYLARGCKRFKLYEGYDNVHEKALMYMGPHEHDDRVEHWVAGKWQTSSKE